MATKKYYRQSENTSYSIAHRILIFAVACLCVFMVLVLLISWGYRYRADQRAANANVIVSTAKLSPCAQEVTNIVAQMWAYNPSNVPMHYWEMAADYINDAVAVRTTGVCNGVRFVCAAGQLRRDCDPCATSSAMAMAQKKHAADMIAQHCSNE